MTEWYDKYTKAALAVAFDKEAATNRKLRKALDKAALHIDWCAEMLTEREDIASAQDWADEARAALNEGGGDAEPR